MEWLRGVKNAWAALRSASSGWSDRMGFEALIPFMSKSAAGMIVTPKSALGLSAYYCAINTIVTDTGSLPFKVYQKRRGGGRDIVSQHPSVSILGSSPDGETTAMRWRQANLGHAYGWGNGHAEIRFTPRGELDGLRLITPKKRLVAKRRPQDKHLYYEDKDRNTYPPWRILHIAGFGFDGLNGYTVPELLAQSLSLTMAVNLFGETFFGNSSIPRVVLKHPRRLNDKVSERLRESWNSLYQGVENSHLAAVLEEGMDVHQLTIPPEDAQFLMTRQFQVLDIARMFRMPPHKLMDYSQAHLTNIEASNIDYMMTVIVPACEMQEQEYNRKIFTEAERERGLYAEHQLLGFLRGDMRARSSFYHFALIDGWMNRNEVRERENLNPIPEEEGGDKYLIGVNMTTLAMAGNPDQMGSPDATRETVSQNGRFAH